MKRTCFPEGLLDHPPKHQHPEGGAAREAL